MSEPEHSFPASRWGHLYSGKVVEAEITAITNQSSGRKVQIAYGNMIAATDPEQITENPATT